MERYGKMSSPNSEDLSQTIGNPRVPKGSRQRLLLGCGSPVHALWPLSKKGERFQLFGRAVCLRQNWSEFDPAGGRI